METRERSALVVEDDADIGALLESTLTNQGFAVTRHERGDGVVELVRDLDPDLVTLDLGLPGLDGMEVCRRIREFSDVYIIILSARGDEIVRLLGLESGADDYLVKPFSLRELKARVNVLMRRPRVRPSAEDPEAAGERLEHAGIVVDVDGRMVFVDGEEVQLTRTEFDLLTDLMRSPARVWTRQALLRSVWGNDWASDTHLVEVHVGNLRKKLGERPDGPGYVRTVRGVGYRMES